MARNRNKNSRMTKSGRARQTGRRYTPRGVPRIALNRTTGRWETLAPMTRVSSRTGRVDPVTGEIYRLVPKAPQAAKVQRSLGGLPRTAPKVSQYRLSPLSLVCIKRKIRKQVLFANSGGSGIKIKTKHFRRNENSKVSC
jgi:hypothetical protein